MSNQNINYHKNYIKQTREEIVGAVQSSVDSKRFNHILRVEQKAVELAEKNHADIEKASIAALLHDYAKQRSDEEFIRYIKEFKLDPILLDYGNAIWHGVVGAEIVKKELKVYDEEILNAIRRHTVGAPYMTILDQIVFMADYIEDGRDFEGVKKARIITENNLQQGVAYQMQSTLEFLVKQNRPIFPATLDSYNAWIGQL